MALHREVRRHVHEGEEEEPHHVNEVPVPGSGFEAEMAGRREVARDLATHDAYRALDAAGVLLRPGLTGTNVMDVVIGVCLDG